MRSKGNNYDDWTGGPVAADEAGEFRGLGFRQMLQSKPFEVFGAQILPCGFGYQMIRAKHAYGVSGTRLGILEDQIKIDLETLSQ